GEEDPRPLPGAPPPALARGRQAAGVGARTARAAAEEALPRRQLGTSDGRNAFDASGRRPSRNEPRRVSDRARHHGGPPGPRRGSSLRRPRRPRPRLLGVASQDATVQPRRHLADRATGGLVAGLVRGGDGGAPPGARSLRYAMEGPRRLLVARAPP